VRTAQSHLVGIYDTYRCDSLHTSRSARLQLEGGPFSVIDIETDLEFLENREDQDAASSYKALRNTEFDSELTEKVRSNSIPAF
jgi:hypothetical protein